MSLSQRDARAELRDVGIARLVDEVDVADGYSTMGPGEFLGEIALIDKGRTTATATTDGPARLFIVGQAAFQSLLGQSPTVRLEIMTALANRVRQLEPADTPLN